MKHAGLWLVAIALPVSLLAQQARPVPKLANGKPDLSGFWQGPLLRNMFERVGGPPFTPAGKAAYDENMTKSINPEGFCLFAGIPRASISGVPFEILHTPRRIAFLYELMTTWRSIPADGRPHRPMQEIEPSYFGDGVAKWDGDQLVIDSIAFKDYFSWIDDDAHPHSGGMHVVERWWRPDFDNLHHELQVDDPKFYSKPWTFGRVFTHMPPGKQPMEYACNENNKNQAEGKLRPGPNVGR